jgi:hypothetical protein
MLLLLLLLAIPYGTKLSRRLDKGLLGGKLPSHSIQELSRCPLVASRPKRASSLELGAFVPCHE